MTKAATKLVKREVGERVDFICDVDQTTVKDLGEGVFETVVTTSGTDRHNEKILTDGIDTTNWLEKNPVVLYGHDYSSLPIGKGLSLKTTKNKMTSKFQLAVNEYPFAATVAALIKGGYLNSVSIGGIVKRWNEDYTVIEQMEMVEYSVVPVPAHQDAIITGRSLEKMTGKTIATIKNEFEDFTRSILVDKVKGMPENEVNQSIKVLKNLVATLEEAAKTDSPDKGKPTNRIKYITLATTAKQVVNQSHRVIKTIKLSTKE